MQNIVILKKHCGCGLLITPTEYVDVDHQFLTCEQISDDQIIRLVLNGTSDGADASSLTSDEMEESELDLPNVTNYEARLAVNTLIRYFESSDLTTDLDSVLKICV